MKKFLTAGNLEVIEALGNTNQHQSKFVKYIDASDEQVRWGSNDDPRGLLEPGKVYEVETVEPHSLHTKYYLKEFPGKKFNSIHFEGVGEGYSKPDPRLGIPLFDEVSGNV